VHWIGFEKKSQKICKFFIFLHHHNNRISFILITYFLWISYSHLDFNFQIRSLLEFTRMADFIKISSQYLSHRIIIISMSMIVSISLCWNYNSRITRIYDDFRFIKLISCLQQFFIFSFSISLCCVVCVGKLLTCRVGEYLQICLVNDTRHSSLEIARCAMN
jgi:hypothetical protein